jgi:hypothetical protein
MLRKILKYIFLFTILFITIFGCSIKNKKYYPLVLSGLSAQNGKCAVLVDVEKENIFQSSFHCPSALKNYVFYDPAKEAFIIFSQSSSSYRVFVTEKTSDHLSNPILTDEVKLLSNVVWSSIDRRIHFIGYKNETGGIQLFSVNVDTSEVSALKTEDLQQFKSIDRIIQLENTIAIAAISKSQKRTPNYPDLVIFLDTKTLHADLIHLPSGCQVYGQIDFNSIIFSDRTYLYKVNPGGMRKLSFRNRHMGQVFGQSVDTSGLYAECYTIEHHQGMAYEKQAVCFFPYDNSSKKKVLFQGKNPCLNCTAYRASDL